MNLQQIKNQQKAYQEKEILEYLLFEELMDPGQIAKSLNVSYTTVRNWINRNEIEIDKSERKGKEFRKKQMQKTFTRRNITSFKPLTGTTFYHRLIIVKHLSCEEQFKITPSQILNNPTRCPICGGD